MNPLKKVIEESKIELDNLWNYVGCSECSGIEVDMEKVQLHISKTISNVLSAIEAEVEAKKGTCSDSTDESQDVWNQALSEVKDLLNSAKETIK